MMPSWPCVLSHIARSIRQMKYDSTKMNVPRLWSIVGCSRRVANRKQHRKVLKIHTHRLRLEQRSFCRALHSLMQFFRQKCITRACLMHINQYSVERVLPSCRQLLVLGREMFRNPRVSVDIVALCTGSLVGLRILLWHDLTIRRNT